MCLQGTVIGHSIKITSWVHISSLHSNSAKLLNSEQHFIVLLITSWVHVSSLHSDSAKLLNSE